MIEKHERALMSAIDTLTKQRDAYAAAADTMAAAHKVERDGLFALHTEQINYTVKIAAERDALELRIGAMIVERSDAFFKVIQERDALKDAARLASRALQRIDAADIRLDTGERLSIAKAIAALKAVL